MKREVILKDIVLNAPWRASEKLDPINAQSVDEIAQSVRDHAKRTGGTGVYGDTGGIVLMQIGDEIVCKAGRHRILGFIKAGIKTINVTVEKADPNDTLNIGAVIDSIAENALQRSSEAELGAVAMAVKLLLRAAMSGHIGNALPMSPKAAESVRGIISTPRGLGLHPVLDFLRTRVSAKFTEPVVRDYMDTLKSSGEYARLVREVAQEFPATPEDEAAADAPKAARKDIKARPKSSGEVAVRATRAASAKSEVTFNAECGSILTNPTHLRVFKKLVTRAPIKSMVAVEDQPKLATQIVKAAKIERPKEGVTGLFIREHIGKIANADKKRTADEKKQFIEADKARVLAELAREFRDNIRRVISTGTKITDLLVHNPGVQWPAHLDKDIAVGYKMFSNLAGFSPSSTKLLTHSKG